MARPPTHLNLLLSKAVTRPSRAFSTTAPSRSALFNLGGLATSREGQYLSREHGIPRSEYSSNIHLIRSSEVDPFAPAPGSTRHANAALSRVDGLKKRLQLERDGLQKFPQAAAVREAAEAAADFRRSLLDHGGGDRDGDPAYLQAGKKMDGLLAQVAELRATVEKLQRRDAGPGVLTFLLPASLVVLGFATGLVWSRRRVSTAAAVEAQAQQRPQVQPSVSEFESAAKAMLLGEAQPVAVETDSQASRNQARGESSTEEGQRSLFDYLFWSSGTGR